MKKAIIIAGIFFLLPLYNALSQETGITLNYKFPELENLVYKVNLNGDAGWSSFDEKPMNFKVKADFIIEMLNLGKIDNLYQIKLTVRKSKILVNDEIFEDTTNSDTEISSFIPQLLLQIDKNGKIHKTTKLKSGMLDFAPFLNLFPCFPDTLTTGTKWIQRIDSFNLPSGKIPQLEFVYVYQGMSKNQHLIKMVSNQIIKHTTKEKDTEVKITGKNSSDGEILFDANSGLVTKATGKMNLNANYIFQVPDPDKKGKFLPVPMRIMLNLNFNFNKVS